MQSKMKHSRQRDAILAYLNTRRDHPTADMVYTALKETMPNISLGTVYRNLSQLADHGMILRISCDGRMDHFDAVTAPHPHFFCHHCGCVSDLITAKPILLPLPDRTEFQGEIEGCHMIYYGTCEACISME